MLAHLKTEYGKLQGGYELHRFTQILDFVLYVQ
jgi:hypothetical protein